MRFVGLILGLALRLLIIVLLIDFAAHRLGEELRPAPQGISKCAI